MKAISLWQPWATLIAIGAKRVETRSWAPPVWLPGTEHPVAIHAAKTQNHLDMAFAPYFREALLEAGYYPGSKPLPLGAVVAVCKIARYREINDGMSLTFEDSHPAEFAFGDYTPGRFAWVLRDVEPVEPVPFTGAQRIFDVDDDLVYGRSLF